MFPILAGGGKQQKLQQQKQKKSCSDGKNTAVLYTKR